MARLKAVKPKPSSGDLIQQLDTLRDQIRDLDKEVAALKTEKKQLEERVIDSMTEQGLIKMSIGSNTVSILENEVPSVEDWDAFYAWVRKNNAMYLLQRRANAAPYRELMATRHGRKIPGVSTVKVRTLSLRKNT